MFCLLQVREEELKATYEALNLSLPCAPTSAQQEVESDAGLPEPGEKLTSFNWNSAESEADESKDELEETEDVSTHELADSSSKESPPWVDELEEEETDVSTHELADSSSKESFPSEDELEEEETDVSTHELADSSSKESFPSEDELEEEETDVSTHELADSSSKESFPSEDESEVEEVYSTRAGNNNSKESVPSEDESEVEEVYSTHNRAGYKNSKESSDPSIASAPRRTVTDKMRRTIMRHLKEQPNYVIAKIGKEIHVTTESLKSLQHINWLHADIVDFYAILLNDRYRITSNPTVKYHVMSNAEMQRIMKNGTPDTVVGMAKKQIDPFSFEILLFFTYLEDRKHWILCIADHRAGTLVCLDSQLPKTNQETSEHDKLEAIQQYLDIEHLRRKGCKTKRYKKETKLDIPQQIGGNDCGVFMCAFAEQICRGAPLNFSQEGVKERRLLMTYEVIVGHIL